MNHSFFQRHGLPLLGYFLLTGVVTWPVLPQFLTHIPGGGDAPWFLWQLWWFKHALLELRQSPFVTDLIYYPLTDVPVTSQTPFNEFFSLPIQVAFGVVPLYNLLFFLSYILSGYFTYLLGLVLVRRRDLAFMGGVIFAFCAYRGMRGLGHLSLLTTEWMPLALLLAIQCWRRPSWQHGAAAGIAAALVALSSPYYLGLFLLPVLLVGVVYLVVWQRHCLWRGALWRAGMVAGVIFAGTAGLFYLPFLFVDPEIHAINQTLTQFTWQYAADLLSWVLPPGYHPLWGRYTAPLYANFTTLNLMETTVFIGTIPLLLAFLTVVLRPFSRSLLFWQLLALTSALLALGPTLYINGNKIVDGLLFHWFSYLPGFDAFRIPSRAGITTALAVSLLSIIALRRLQSRLAARQWRLLWPVLTLLILVDSTPIFPYPTATTVIPRAYTAIAEAADRLAVLEVPGEFVQHEVDFFAEFSWYMYYQTYHQKPIVSGYLGRRPARLTYPEQHLPFVRQFFQFTEGRRLIQMPPLALLPDPFWPDEIWRGQEGLAQQGIGHLLLHCRPANPATCTNSHTLLQQSLGVAAYRNDALTYYRVPPSTYTTMQAPAFLITPPVDFGAAFSTVALTAAGRERTLLQEQGTITLTIPFTGVWAIAGEVIGEQAKNLAFTLDGVALLPPLVALPDGVMLDWEQEMAPGLHQLQLSLPANTVPANPTCTELCLRNFHVKLTNVLPATPRAPLATFVTDADLRLELVATKLFTLTTNVPAAPHRQLLMNTWRLDDNSYTILRDSPMQMPVNYIHLTDEDGNTLAQVDHPLGERRIDLVDQKIILDLVPLPLLDGAAAPTELRLGLWYPSTRQYFWPPDTALVDQNGRTRIGKFADFSQALRLPALPNNADLLTTFENFTDGRTLRLLDAYIIVDPANGEQRQLAMVWAEVDLFIPPVSVTLLADLTDQAGTIIQTVAHKLGTQQLTWHDRRIRYDLINLPQEWGDPALEVRIGLIYADNGQRYQADRIDLIDAEERVRLGTIAELQRAK